MKSEKRLSNISVLVFLLLCGSAIALFALLPEASLNAGVVYGGF